MPDLELDLERRRVGLAFLAIAALAPLVVGLTPGSSNDPRAVTAYLVITWLVAVASWRWWDRLDLVSGPGAAAYVVAVVILRDAEGGGASGLAPLFLLPLFWCSLVGTRRSLVTAVVATALALVLPILLLGDPRYPVTEWRRAAIWLTVAPVVGGATLGLRRRADAARQAVSEQARTDALTGCLNRRGLEEVAHRELARARRNATPIAVALLDIDHFKQFNDTHGHDAGDDLLRLAARVWQDSLRETDVLARWGGEEFVVLLPDTTGRQALDVVDRLRLATPMDQSCSIGVATVARSKDDDGLAGAIRRADTALYAAKEGGRNRVVAAS